jgi:DNA-binding CsgD family transcriptional regulator/tetratricopeptide (TPR) repeat protein
VLLERDEELGRLDRLLDAASAGEGSVTVISGEAGVGKTALLEAAVRGSRSVGVRPLLAHASELEREFSLGVIRQLMEPAVLGLDDDARAAAFTGAAAPASTVLDLEEAPDLERDPLTTIHGLYWLSVNVSASQPLLLAVDDLQWADEMSLRALAYLARRLAGVPIALVASLRTGEEMTETAAQAVDEIAGRAETARIDPSALGQEAVAELLAAQLEQEVDTTFASACRELTGGNPFLLTELATELAAEGIVPTKQNANRLGAFVPERVGKMVRRHLKRLGPDARSLADAVAVLGDGEEVGVAAAMVNLDRGIAAAAAGELVEARVFADSKQLRFRHPLLRAAAEDEIPAPELGTRHARAAEVLERAGAPAVRVAPHLLHSPPAGDERVVEQLRAAARSARSQGDSAHAARLLERALVEPPPSEVRSELVEEAAQAEFAVVRPDAAEHFREARDATSDPSRRATLALGEGMSRFYTGDHRGAVEAMTAAADEASGDPSVREDWLMLESFLALVRRYDLATVSESESRIGGLAGELKGETPGERLILAFVASMSPGRTAADLVAATDLNVATHGSAPWAQHSEGVGDVAMYLHAGRPDKAEALADRLVADSTERQLPLKRAMSIAARGIVALDVGDIATARTDLEESADAAEEFGVDHLRQSNSAFLVTALAQMGELDSAERVLVDNGLAGEIPEHMILNPAVFGRAVLRMEQRRFEEAAADLADLGRRYETLSVNRPSPPWRSERALTLDALGERAAGRELAEEELEIARVWDTPKSIATAERALGLLSDGDEALERLGTAEELLRDGPWRFDRARARLDLGAALRRAGERRSGRELLTEAMDEAHAIGAAPLADRAAQELRASGARPRKRAVTGFDALTPSELRVARLAAEGRSNREIAQELFVTMATVETHLTRVYRKLDLDGRERLPGALPEA